MACPRCQRPLLPGAACARCDEETFGPLPSPTALYRQAAPPVAPGPDPTEPAWLRDPARHVRLAARTINLLLGGPALFLGISVALLSYAGMLGRGGTRYVFALALIAFGGQRFLRGLVTRD